MKTSCVTSLVVSLILCGAADAVCAASDADQSYIRSLATPGKTVLVVEYLDGQKKAVTRKGYATTSGFKAVSPTDIEVDTRTRLHLYGLQPCDGEMVNRKEGYAGACAAFAQEQLAILIKAPKVIFCRAFVSEENAPVQDVTCDGYHNFPGSLDAVENLEEQLLSIGAVRLARKPDGTLMRPDLVEAEKIGRSGFGMWADPRVQNQ